MQPTVVNRIIEDPLAGCLDIIYNEGVYVTLCNSLYLRLRIFYAKEIVDKIKSRIEKDSEDQIMPTEEYVINELQYELRFAGKGSTDFESQILNRWSAILMKQYETDEVLDFVSDIIFFRDLRVRF